MTATLPELGRIPLGGTAVGNGLNTHPEFADRVRRRLGERTSPGVAALIAAPADHFAAQASRDALVSTSGALKTVAVALTKICNDLRWMSSGPARVSARSCCRSCRRVRRSCRARSTR